MNYQSPLPSTNQYPFSPQSPIEHLSFILSTFYHPFRNLSSDYITHSDIQPLSSSESTINNNNLYYQHSNTNLPVNTNTNIYNNYFLQNSQFFITNYNTTQPHHNMFNNTTHKFSYTYNIPSNNELLPLIKEVKCNSSDDKSTSNKLILGKKKKRATKMCTACPHKYAIHYAKNMCSNCYHIKGRSKKPWNCSHVNKSHYALGLCQNCYQMNYIRKHFESENSFNNKDDNNSLGK